MHRSALGRASLASSSSASGREPLSEYAHGTTRHSRPSAAAVPATARSAPRSGDVSTAHALVDEPLRELQLSGGLAVGVGHERAARGAVELALDGPHQLLVPEIA